MDIKKAKDTLYACFDEAQKMRYSQFAPLSKQILLCINTVISSDHKTFKYILFTALLAKATDESVDILSLQKQDRSLGAYDARSLCHKVIVPFEKSELDKVLGGSNEPYLNKPARFPRLTPENAVRRGKDHELLLLLCESLPKIKTEAEAKLSLCYLLVLLLEKLKQKEKDRQFSIPSSANTNLKLLKFINSFTSSSQEGETLVLAISGLYHLLYLDAPEYRVEIHPVNESGASSKEVSDLDIYKDDKLIISNELKDKQYSLIDVRHAIDKVIQAGGTQMLFIEGPQAKTRDTEWYSKLTTEYQEKGFFINIIYYETFARLILTLLPQCNANEYIHFIRKVAESTKFKESTIKLIDEVAENTLGMSR